MKNLIMKTAYNKAITHLTIPNKLKDNQIILNYNKYNPRCSNYTETCDLLRHALNNFIRNLCLNLKWRQTVCQN